MDSGIKRRPGVEKGERERERERGREKKLSVPSLFHRARSFFFVVSSFWIPLRTEQERRINA